MTPDEFRTLALALPDAVEQGHMGHPDFRVRGKIFATMGSPSEGMAMVKLKPEQQHALLAMEPGAFAPASGAWGRSGCTIVTLDRADVEMVHEALTQAWHNLTSHRA